MTVCPVVLDHEPQQFAAGDSLYFRRFIPEFPPGQGYFLSYELLTEAGQPAFGPFLSVDNNGAHLIEIDGFAANQPPGNYILAGYAFSPPGADALGGQSRQQVYKGNLLLTPNLANQQAVPCQKSFNQKMVEQWEETYAALSQAWLVETDINRVRILRMKHAEAWTELAKWREIYANELNRKGIRNGLPDQSRIRPNFHVFGYGGGFGR
jgi:hypothetical protein